MFGFQEKKEKYTKKSFKLYKSQEKEKENTPLSQEIIDLMESERRERPVENLESKFF